MILYHGTILESGRDIVLNGINLNKCREYSDFGKGFYTTPDKSFAEICAMTKAGVSNKSRRPVIVRFEADWERVRGHQYFDKADVNWGQFIINNRTSNKYLLSVNTGIHNKDLKYHIVQGPTADARITDMVNEFEKLNKPVSDDDIQKFKSHIFGEQISFHTEIALSLLKNATIIDIERRV